MDTFTVEKRKHPRYPLSAPICIKCGNGETCSVFQTTSKDISSSGVHVHTGGMDLPFMQKVELEMTLTINKIRELFGCSGHVTLQIDGSVIRSHKDGLVIKFNRKYSIFPAQLEMQSEYDAFYSRAREGELVNGH